MKLKALIVDDEYPSRAELRYLLQHFQDRVEIIGEATHVSEAKALLSAVPYDLLFLDIAMPGVNGLDLAKELLASPKPPFIVFVTAYQDYAVQAFEVNAIDYLLKPFDEKRLAQTLSKVFRTKEGPISGKEESLVPEPPPAPQTARPGLDRLLAEKQGKKLLVDKKEVIYAYAEDNAIYLKLYNEAVLTRYTMKELSVQLKEPLFFRTHRQYLVNLKKVREIVPYFNGAFTLVVDDAQRTEVPVSRGQAKRLRPLLGM